MRTIISTLLSCLLAVLIYLGWTYTQMQSSLNSPMQINSSDAQLFEVRSGETLSSISNRLKESGWYDKPRYLTLEARRLNLDSQIKVGEYTVSPETTPKEFLNLLVSGEVKQHSVTLIEGLTFREWRTALASEEKLTQTIQELSDQAIMEKLGYPDQHPEGRFYADSYFYTSDMTDLDVLKRAYLKMEETVKELWDEREEELPYTDPYEAMIMASIIEKETAVESERPTISGVFVRRLHKGMKLQTDPTVIYGVGEEFDGDITRKHLRTDTPYNTYTREGLPPTPIAMFSTAALHAALHPEEGKSLFFVAKGDGTHVFSETLKAHNAAVRKYQLKQ